MNVILNAHNVRSCERKNREEYKKKHFPGHVQLRSAVAEGDDASGGGNTGGEDAGEGRRGERRGQCARALINAVQNIYISFRVAIYSLNRIKSIS